MSFLGLLCKQTLRQGFENKQSQEKLVGNSGVSETEKGRSIQITWVGCIRDARGVPQQHTFQQMHSQSPALLSGTGSPLQ